MCGRIPFHWPVWVLFLKCVARGNCHMSNALKKQESDSSYLYEGLKDWQQESAVATLIHKLVEGAACGAFEDRLAQLVLRDRLRLPFEVREMAELHLFAFGRTPCLISRAQFRTLYGSRIVRELLGGKSLPADMGKKGPEILFFGALMTLLVEGSKEHEAAKAAWNSKVQRHYKVA